MTKSIQTIPFIVSLLFMASLTPLQAAAPEAWFEAAEEGNKATLQKLRPQVYVNAKHEHKFSLFGVMDSDSGETALHFSAQNGHLAVVQWLVGQGADIHATTTKYGWTALHYSAYNGHLAVVKYLVQEGADIEAKAKYGRTALDFARQEKNQAVVQFLKGPAISVHLKAQIHTLKATIAKLNTDHQRALQQQEVAYNNALEAQESAFQQKEEALQTKIDRLKATIENSKADTKERETKLKSEHQAEMQTREIAFSDEVERRVTELEATLQAAHQDTVQRQQTAFETREKKLKDSSKQKEEESAAEINMLKTTIESLKAQYKEREAKLVAEYEDRMRKREIEFKGELEARERERELAKKKQPDKGVIGKWLDVAKEGDIKQLEELYNNYEINPNGKNEDNYTALHWSARNGHLGCVQFLLGQGADIHCKNSYGYTALLWSAQQGNLACLKCLVEQGADIHAKTKWGETALQWAARKGYLDCTRYLEQKMQK